ncbi:hypothetical protein MRB53_016991 [Persea americana]|uniref:Uncharacterized protein n=1 Tax=Persea americana TaxID=3435 RepID=A0ACC2M3N8_PERAE|nr:hypothetical protein MRB53_016991 [Persea americana]
MFMSFKITVHLCVVLLLLFPCPTHTSLALFFLSVWRDIMPFGLVSAWNKRRRCKSYDQNESWIYKPVEYWQLEDQRPPSKRHHGSSVFTLKEMDQATCSFSEENLIGKGGFGRVYRGVLWSGEVVAIKKMELPPFKAAEDFWYEFMQNGSLQDHLDGISQMKMDWPSRLKIALGAARGLAYLHSGSTISDFGLAKLMPEGQELYVTTKVLGTFGYFDPEYTSAGKLTLQSDVYAFGVVLLELLTGRRALDLNQGPADQSLVLQVRNILSDRKKLRKVIDPEMNRSSYTMESIIMFANLASRCVRSESSDRPVMVECVKELELIFTTNIKAFHSHLGI